VIRERLVVERWNLDQFESGTACITPSIAVRNASRPTSGSRSGW
jgi:hypothetical protein